MIILLLACAPKAPIEAPAEANPSGLNSTLTDPAAVRVHMSEHLEMANGARDAFIQGHVETAREKLSWFGDHPEPVQADATWTPFLANMYGAALEGESAGTTHDMGDAIGKLGAACGTCHVTHAVQLSPVLAAEAPASDELKAHMARHFWAVQSMWTGLVSSQSSAWVSGAQALAEHPPETEDFGKGGLTDEQVALATNLHALAADAGSMTDQAARGAAFGDIVTACASCHIAVRK